MTASGLLRCEHCGRLFLRPNLMGRAPKYCSTSHRQAAYVGRKLAALRATIREQRAEILALRRQLKRQSK